MFLAVLFFVSALAQKTVHINQATLGACSNAINYWDFISTGSCSPDSCTCDAGNVSCTSSSCAQVFGTGFPNPPAGLATGAIFYTHSGFNGAQCNTIDTYASVFVRNTQCQRLKFYSAIACCNNGSMTWNMYAGSTCTGSVISSRISPAGGCNAVPGLGYTQNSCPALGPNTCPAFVSTTTTTSTTTPAAGSSNSCFHVDTCITYKSAIYALADLRGLHECSIPHVVTTSGLRLETSLHVVRVTPDHLIFSRDHLVRSSTLRVGDMIDTIDGPMPIKTITIETDQTYFGLNCLESIVHANGVRTSTFGSYHAIPAAWMSVIGRIAGIQRASRWGDRIASVWHSI